MRHTAAGVIITAHPPLWQIGDVFRQVTAGYSRRHPESVHYGAPLGAVGTYAPVAVKMADHVVGDFMGNGMIEMLVIPAREYPWIETELRVAVPEAEHAGAATG